MITSVFLADVKPRETFSLLVRGAPDPATVPGLRSAHIGIATPMRTSFVPKLGLRRVGLVTFWDDDAALDGFEATHPIAAALAGGYRARLAPLRAHGTWPGLDPDVPTSRRVDYEGPVAALTLARSRVSQSLRFLRTSAKAEAAATTAPGLLWATALARPPFFATFSLWESSDAIAAYAFNGDDAAHPSAIRGGRVKPFHITEAFIRFRPVATSGKLDGVNPLRERLPS